MYAVEVDEAFCVGHGKCYLVDPELMEPRDDLGHARYVGGPIDDTDAMLLRRAGVVVDSCPEQALTLTHS